MSDIYNHDGFEFSFTPEEGRRLRSFAVVNGVPEFRFERSPKVPALTEEDIAVAFRLAHEGKRPQFYYIPIPPTHPFFGRQYKQYLPEWLEGTSIGEALSETDWAMKGLTKGLRSDESKSKFWAWEKSSQLKGLATSLEFPRDKSGGSVIMSCEPVTVRTSGSEIEFVGEPRLHINAESSLTYTRYINRVLPSVAYHDEPLFLKFGEIVKLTIAAERLVEMGVKISRRWLEEHSNRSTTSTKLAVPCKPREEGAAATHPGTNQPEVQKDDFDAPSKDVAVKKSEAKHCRKLSLVKKEKSILLYGYCDVGNGEFVQCNADGTTHAKVKSLKAYCERRICIDGKVLEATQYRVKIPFPERINGEDDPAHTESQDLSLRFGEFSEKIGSVSMDFKVGTHVPGEDLTMTVVAKGDSSDSVKTISVMRATLDDYNVLYKGLDPNLPLRPEIPGVCEGIVPDVQSWNELYSKTVPWPQVWQISRDEGTGVFSTSMGGVTTSTPVIEERRRREEPARRHEGETVVQGVRTIRYQGKDYIACMRDFVISTEIILKFHTFYTHAGTRITEVSLAMDLYTRILETFKSTWISRKPMPTVRAVFEVTNTELKKRCDDYKTGLPSQKVELHFHGTTLACDILGSRGLCRNAQCGICGISDAGLDPTRIKRNLKFGSGFYLAPHSSTCHEYTKPGPNGCRALLLCEVSPGRKFQASADMDGPPSGYDSVEGLPGTGTGHSMIALYHPPAVMPRFIIVY